MTQSVNSRDNVCQLGSSTWGLAYSSPFFSAMLGNRLGDLQGEFGGRVSKDCWAMKLNQAKLTQGPRYGLSGLVRASQAWGEGLM